MQLAALAADAFQMMYLLVRTSRWTVTPLYNFTYNGEYASSRTSYGVS